MQKGGAARLSALFIGAALIVAVSLFTLTHLTDRIVFLVLVPGFAVGLLLIGLSIALRKPPGGRRTF